MTRVVRITADMAEIIRALATKPLTTRELQCLDLVSHGYDNGEIGRRLSICEDTVKTHLRRIFTRLQVRNRTHLVRRAFEIGLLRAYSAPIVQATKVNPRPGPRSGS